MMLVSAYGRLGQDPRSIETKSGKPMCVSSMAVDLNDKDGESHTQWLNVVAFGRNADLLGRQKRGDLASISGRCQINRWINGDGQAQVQLSIIVDSIISSRSAGPASNVRRPASETGIDDGLTDNNAMDGAQLDDEIPF